MTTEACPACQARLSYEVDGKTYSRVIGIEIPGVYDGVLYWRCPCCGYDWHRWDDEHMRLKAALYMNQQRR